MASNKIHKFVTFLGAILCFVAVIPIDVLSWWKADISQDILGTTYHFSNYVNAFGQFYNKTLYSSDYTITDLGSIFLFAGIIVIIGGIIMIIGGAKESKGIAVLGAIVTLIGPIVFLVALNGLDPVVNLFLSSNAAKFFGSGDVYTRIVIIDVQYGSGTWYLNIGFFLPIIGAVLGFLSLKNSSK